MATMVLLIAAFVQICSNRTKQKQVSRCLPSQHPLLPAKSKFPVAIKPQTTSPTPLTSFHRLAKITLKDYLFFTGLIAGVVLRKRLPLAKRSFCAYLVRTSLCACTWMRASLSSWPYTTASRVKLFHHLTCQGQAFGEGESVYDDVWQRLMS